MIVCPRCSKENQDHYKFCLGCGSELPRDAAKKEFVAPTRTDPPAPRAEPTDQARNLQFAATQQGDVATASVGTAAAAKARPEPVRAPAAAPEPAARPSPSQLRNCPSCNNPVPPDFKFCGTCGHNMQPPGPASAGAPPTPSLSPSGGAAGATAAALPRGRLLLINPDGSEGSAHPLPEGSSQIGRGSGQLFAGDAYLSPVHATFSFGGDSCIVRDEDSLNGVYVKIARDAPVPLNVGDVFRIGQEIIRFEAIERSAADDGVEVMGSPEPGYLGRIALIIGRDSTGNAFPVPPDGLHIGRERGDVTFPEDGYVSGLHCRIHHDGSGVVLTDVGSSNGTFRRVKGETKVKSGELLLMGQQLFRLEY